MTPEEIADKYTREGAWANPIMAAVVRERDAEWRAALREQHNGCAETIDHIYRNAVAPDREYPFDHECVFCEALRGLIEDAAEPPKEASKELK